VDEQTESTPLHRTPSPLVVESTECKWCRPSLRCPCIARTGLNPTIKFCYLTTPIYLSSHVKL